MRRQTATRLRPFARRALMIARPLAVFMRTRKPWVFWRWVVDGWKVRFMWKPLLKLKECRAEAGKGVARNTRGEKPEIIADSGMHCESPRGIRSIHACG